MNKIIFILTVILVSGCGENRNQQMTKLLNEKKVLTRSYGEAHKKEVIFNARADSFHYSSTDSSFKSLALVDSSHKYFDEASKIRSKIIGIDFSIDSLSKMK